MFTYAECALMADAVYHVDVTNAVFPATQPAQDHSAKALTQAGFRLVGVYESPAILSRAAIWSRGGWFGFAVRGTVPLDPSLQNVTQDYVMKALSTAPLQLVRAAVGPINKIIGPPRGRCIMVGHSLGGSVAQLLGLLYGVPFVTFNAPGMRYDVMRKGWVRAGMRQVDSANGPAATVATMLPGIRSLTNWAVRETPGLDQSFDEARGEIAQGAGLPPPDITAALGPDQQLGFNIAHTLDTIHNLTGPPIGSPYRPADWTPTPAQVAETIAVPALGIGIYHDMTRMAQFLAHHNWGHEHPVYAVAGARGRIFYARTHYAPAPGWESAAA